jgi:hypothetical protein
MNAQTNLIAQLDDALGQSDIGRRADTPASRSRCSTT